MYVPNQFDHTEKPMEKLDLEAVPLDELWSLHEQITRVLSSKIIAQKQELEERLRQLGRVPADAVVVALKRAGANGAAQQRRKYPRVLPKYQNPSEPAETWSGRGKQPRWLVSALKAGAKIEDFRISDEIKGKARARR
jgi:DNA-binding protein H-NS